MKADNYFTTLLEDIKHNGVWSKQPRTKWSDGTPAQYKSVYGKTYNFDISKGEFPITTLRTTPFRGCFEEMRWIYQLQSNIIEDAHPSIHSWWADFVTEVIETPMFVYGLTDKGMLNTGVKKQSSIGKTYGYIIQKYDLMNKLLYGLEHNPESRRHIINMWDNQSQLEDPKALPPCAYMTKWRIVEREGIKQLDITLYQRSKDTAMVYSINPTEYVFLQMMVAGHLTWATGIEHIVGQLDYKVEDEHIYDRNYWALEEILDKKPTGLQPKIEMVSEPKNFYDYRWEDFKVTGLEGITPLSKKLEIAI